MNLFVRANRQSPLLLAVVSVLLGMLVGAVLMVLAGYDPVRAYSALFRTPFTQSFDIGETIRTISPLIMTGLAVAIAFRTGLFNIGAEGQYIIGQLVAIIVALKLPLPPVLHALVAMILGGLAGALWAFLPGLLKATRGVHEVITTIMMNFLAFYLSNFLVRSWLSSGADSTPMIPESASIRWDVLTGVFANSRIHLGIFIALLLALFMHWLLWRTTVGFEFRAVGLNPHASQYAGMSVRRSIILSMMISGFFAGLAGATEMLGTDEYLTILTFFNGLGFDGIAVALLGGNTPLGVILAAVLFGILTYGGGTMQFEANVPFEVIRVVFAAIILFVAANVTGWIVERFRRERRVKADA